MSIAQAIGRLPVPLYAQDEAALAAGITDDAPARGTRLRTAPGLMQRFGASRPTVCKARPTRPLFRSSCRVRQAIVEMPAESPVSGRRDHSKPSASNCHCQRRAAAGYFSDSPVSEVAALGSRKMWGVAMRLFVTESPARKGARKSGSRPPLGVRACGASVSPRPISAADQRAASPRGSLTVHPAGPRLQIVEWVGPDSAKLAWPNIDQERRTMLSLRVVPTGLAQVGLVAALTPTWETRACGVPLSDKDMGFLVKSCRDVERAKTAAPFHAVERRVRRPHRRRACRLPNADALRRGPGKNREPRAVDDPGDRRIHPAQDAPAVPVRTETTPLSGPLRDAGDG